MCFTLSHILHYVSTSLDSTHEACSSTMQKLTNMQPRLDGQKARASTKPHS